MDNITSACVALLTVRCDRAVFFSFMLLHSKTFKAFLLTIQSHQKGILRAVHLQISI